MIERTTIVTAQITGIAKYVTNDVDAVMETPEQTEEFKNKIAQRLKDHFDADDVVVTIQDFINDEARE